MGVSTIGETLEIEWESLNNDRDEKYGRDFKNNSRALEGNQIMKHFTEKARQTEDVRFLLRLPMMSIIFQTRLLTQLKSDF